MTPADDSARADPAIVEPDDEHNRQLVSRVRPPQWQNPAPASRYNLVVIGAGTAGLVTAAIAAGLGARVALVEKHLLGGDCLNVGCVPSKAVLRAARAWAALGDMGEFGVRVPAGVERDFGAVMERMRRIRASISRNDSAERFTGLGVDVFIGEARFTSPRAIDVAGHTLRFRRAAICTGARASAPPIPGLHETGYHTNETIFALTALPRHFAVVGGGPIGCELAQAFARLGSRVTVLERESRILPRDDGDAATLVQDRMARDGVQFTFNASVTQVSRRGAAKVVQYEGADGGQELVVDEILIGAGRAPNVEGLGLDAAGVTVGRDGVTVNRYLQTSQPHIYAAGDVCSPHKFTHAADAMAQALVQNALFPHPLGLGRVATDRLIMPWCTYTDPALAHVGLPADEVAARREAIDTFTVAWSDVDRAIIDGDEDGFARVHVKKGSDRILGATIVAADAGNMISEITLAMRAGVGLGTIGRTIHPYPTQADVLRKVAIAMRKAGFGGRQKALLRRWFSWTR